MKNIDPRDVSENAIRLIGDKWTLISAGVRGNFNSMTASWGGLGEIWGKPVAFIFIRPQRHTFGFVEKSGIFTLSFFEEKYRPALKIFGTRSGRDCDKPKLANLTPEFTASGAPYFAEASLVLECRKMYADMIRPECFLDREQIGWWYPQADFHKMYVAEITSAMRA